MSPILRVAPLVLVSVLCSCGGDPSPPGSLPDAGEPDVSPGACDAPGETRERQCGNCGRQLEVCSAARAWEPDAFCSAERECPAGEREVVAASTCAERVRTCSASCFWGDWQEPPADECEPGEERLRQDFCERSEYRVETCSDTCMWTEEECSNPCGGTRRFDPRVEEEICIPAGDFVRGDELFPSAQPVRNVDVSAFYLDRFPVTNGRYLKCMTEGVCTAPRFEGGELVDDPLHVDFPAHSLTNVQAAAFCDWDGGRRIPTEAEWEKAARGPAPRSQPFMWDGEFPCDLLRAGPCGSPSGGSTIPNRVYDRPQVRSFYGVEMMVGGGYEWVSDWFQPDYYEDDASLTDPQGPMRGGLLVRGAPLVGTLEDDFRVSRRWSISPSATRVARCARDAL